MEPRQGEGEVTSHIERGALALLIGLSAGMLGGCDDGTRGDWRVCADAQGRRLPDGRCGGGGGTAYLKLLPEHDH